METIAVVTYNETDLGNMFLPIGDMLQINTIAQIADEVIIGEKNITALDWIFQLHFPGDPIYPGTLLIEGAGQIIAIWGWHNGLRGKPRLVKVSAEFKSPVTATDTVITYTGTIYKRRNVIIGKVVINVSGRHIGTVQGSIVICEDSCNG